jgi:Cupin domain
LGRTKLRAGAGDVGEGEEVRVARPGDLVFKPRGVPHAFWNAGDEPARALEIISPAGFERYFTKIAPLLPPNHPGPPDEEALGVIMAKYRLDMDFASIPLFVERHGLVPG